MPAFGVQFTLDAFYELNRDVGRGNALKNFKLKAINQEYS